jgi:hypothetical protein
MMPNDPGDPSRFCPHLPSLPLSNPSLLPKNSKRREGGIERGWRSGMRVPRGSFSPDPTAEYNTRRSNIAGIPSWLFTCTFSIQKWIFAYKNFRREAGGNGHFSREIFFCKGGSAYCAYPTISFVSSPLKRRAARGRAIHGRCRSSCRASSRCGFGARSFRDCLEQSCVSGRADTAQTSGD